MIDRFIRAQDKPFSAENTCYEQALSEIKNGRKSSHWIWFVFPQLKELGRSDTAHFYGIDGLEEAREYLAHPVLRARLIEISEALLAVEGRSALAILDSHTDVLKVRSSMTLFHKADPEEPVFGRVLEKYYGGREDRQTLELLKTAQSGKDSAFNSKNGGE